VVPLLNTALDEDTFSANLMSIIATFVPGRRGVATADAQAWLADLHARADAGEYFFSVNRYCVLALAR